MTMLMIQQELAGTPLHMPILSREESGKAMPHVGDFASVVAFVVWRRERYADFRHMPISSGSRKRRSKIVDWC
jgi:hypothetical protein